MSKITDAQFEEQIKDYSEENKSLLRNVREQLKGLEKANELGLKSHEATEKTIDSIKQEYGNQFKELTEMLETLATKVEQSKHEQKLQRQSFNDSLNKAIADNAQRIKDAYTNNQRVVLDVKSVATITTANSTIEGSVPVYAGTQVAPPANANLRTDSVLPLCTTFNTNMAAFPYTETLPKDGDFSFQTEGSAKSQIDFTTETRYAEPKTNAAWEKLTKQSVEDIPFLQSVATDLLRRKHDIKKSKAIVADVISLATSFTAGSLADTVVNPNIMDVINAMITKIASTHNYTDEADYMPNVVLISYIDFFKEFVAAKDDLGRPLYPNAALFGMLTIGGMMVIPDRDITVGDIFVGDMKVYNVSNYVPYSVSIGWTNTDFIQNQFVILGESRYHAFVRQLDKIALMKGTIATIKSALAI